MALILFCSFILVTTTNFTHLKVKDETEPSNWEGKLTHYTSIWLHTENMVVVCLLIAAGGISCDTCDDCGSGGSSQDCGDLLSLCGRSKTRGDPFFMWIQSFHYVSHCELLFIWHNRFPHFAASGTVRTDLFCGTSALCPDVGFHVFAYDFSTLTGLTYVECCSSDNCNSALPLCKYMWKLIPHLTRSDTVVKEGAEGPCRLLTYPVSVYLLLNVILFFIVSDPPTSLSRNGLECCKDSTCTSRVLCEGDEDRCFEGEGESLRCLV